MVQNEFIQELRGTWGPAPIEDPERHAVWGRKMELLAQVPDLLGNRVRTEGVYRKSLVRDVGSKELLAVLAADCIKSFLSIRSSEPLSEAIKRVTDSAPWQNMLDDKNAVQRSRFRSRLGDEITLHLTAVLIGNTELCNWFLPDVSQVLRATGNN